VQAPGAFTDGASSYSPSAWQPGDPDNGQPISASRVTAARAAASGSGVFRVQATLPAAAPAGRYALAGGLLVKTGKRESANMAQKTIVSLIDDISGGPADETVSFGVDGQDYVIDLAADSAGKMRVVIGRYAGVARVVKVTPVRPRRHTRTGAGRQRSREIRQWAIERGLLTSERGRIPEHVAREYEASKRVVAGPVSKRGEPPADLTGRERVVMASIRDTGKPGKGGNVVAGKLRQRGLVERDDSTGAWSITKGGGA
jgi:hypothetical protein